MKQRRVLHAIFRAHSPPSEYTNKGHLKKQQQNFSSTRKSCVITNHLDAHLDQELNNNKLGNILVTIVVQGDIKESCSDQIGQFSVFFSLRNNYLFIMHN